MGRNLLEEVGSTSANNGAGRNLLEEVGAVTPVASSGAGSIPVFPGQRPPKSASGGGKLFPDAKPVSTEESTQMLSGPFEAGAEMLRGATMMIPAGLAGIGELLAGGSLDDATQTINKVQQFGATQNPYAKQVLEHGPAGVVAKKVSEFATGAGDIVKERLENPLFGDPLPQGVTDALAATTKAGVELGTWVAGAKILGAAPNAVESSMNSMPIRRIKSKFVKERGLTTVPFERMRELHPEMSLGEFLRKYPQYKEQAFAERSVAETPVAESATAKPAEATKPAPKAEVNIPEADRIALNEIDERYFGIENAPDDVLANISPASLRAYMEARDAEIKASTKPAPKATTKSGGKTGRTGWRANKKYSGISSEQRDALESVVDTLENYEDALAKFTDPEGNITHAYALHVARDKFGVESPKSTKPKTTAKADKKDVTKEETGKVEEFIEPNENTLRAEEAKAAEEEALQEELDQQTQAELVAEEKVAIEEPVIETPVVEEPAEPKLAPDQIAKAEERAQKEIKADEEAKKRELPEVHSMLDSIEETKVPGEVRDAIANSTNKVRTLTALIEAGKTRKARKFLDDEDPFGLLEIEAVNPRAEEIIDILVEMEGDLRRKVGETANVAKKEEPVVEPEPVVEEPKIQTAEFKDLDSAELDYDLNPRKFGSPETAAKFLEKRPDFDTVVKVGNKYHIGRLHPDTELRGGYDIDAISRAEEGLDEPIVKDLPKPVETEVIKVQDTFNKVSEGVYISNLEDGRMVAIMKESAKNWEVYLGTPAQVQSNTGELIGAYPTLAKARKALGEGKKKKVRQEYTYSQLIDFLDDQVKAYKEEKSASRADELERLIAEQEQDALDNQGDTMSLDDYAREEEGDGHGYFEERDLGDVYDDLVTIFKDERGSIPLSSGKVVMNAGVNSIDAISKDDQYGRQLRKDLAFNKKDFDERGLSLRDRITELIKETNHPVWKRKYEEALNSVGDEHTYETGKEVTVRVFHGSQTGQIETFSIDHLGSNTGAGSAAQGFFFSGAPKTANALSYIGDPLETNSTMYPVVVNFKNPLVVDYGGSSHRLDSYGDVMARAKEEGHDGVIFLNTFDGGGLDNIFTKFSNKGISSALSPHSFSSPEIQAAKKRLAQDITRLGQIARNTLKDPKLTADADRLAKENSRLRKILNRLRDERGSIQIDGSPIVNLIRGIIRDIAQLFRNIKKALHDYKMRKIQDKQIQKKTLSVKEKATVRNMVTSEIRNTVQALKSSGDQAVSDMVQYLEGNNRIVPTQKLGDKTMPTPQKPMINTNPPVMRAGAVDLVHTLRRAFNMESPSHVFGRVFDLDNNPVIDAMEASMANNVNRRNFLVWKRTVLNKIPNDEPVVRDKLEPLYQSVKPLVQAITRNNKLINKLEREKRLSEGDEARTAMVDEKLKSARRHMKKNTKKFNDFLENTIRPAITQLAKEVPGVRVILNAAEQLPEGIELTNDELMASMQVRKYFDFTAERMGDAGLNVLRTRTYMHRILPEAMKDNENYAKSLGVPAVLNFMHQSPSGQIWFPSAHMILNKYIPLVERKINYQHFLNRWSDFIAEAPPEMHQFMTEWIDKNLNRNLESKLEKVLNTAVAFEYMRLIAFSTSVAFKHLTKAADTLAIYNGVTDIKAVSKAAKAMFDIAMHKVGARKSETNDMKLLRAYVNSRALTRMMDESPGAKVILESMKRWSGGPVIATEFLDNGITILATAMAGHMKGYSPEYIHKVIWDTVLLANFRGGWDQPLPLKSAVGRGVGMFQTTPYKLLEFRIDMVGKALKGETDAFGTPYGNRLLKYVMAIGMAETIARLRGTSLLDIWLHTPYLSHFMTPKEGYPGFELHEPKPNTSPILQYAVEANRKGAWTALKEHFNYFGQFSKTWKAMHQTYPTDWYNNPIDHMLGIPRVDAPRGHYGKKKKKRGRGSRRR